MQLFNMNSKAIAAYLVFISLFLIAFVAFAGWFSPNPEEYVEIFEKLKKYDPFISKLDKGSTKRVSGKGIMYISTKSGEVSGTLYDSEGKPVEIHEWYYGVYSIDNQLDINKEVFDEYPPKDLNELDFAVFMKVSFKPVFRGRLYTWFFFDQGVKIACESKIEAAIVDLKSKLIVAENTFSRTCGTSINK